MWQIKQFVVIGAAFLTALQQKRSEKHRSGVLAGWNGHC
jgi:hypothetical protein